MVTYREFAPSPELRGRVRAYFSFTPGSAYWRGRRTLTREVLFTREESFCSPLFADGHTSLVIVYDKLPSSVVPGAQRLRDIQAGLQIDYKVGNLPFVGATAVSGSYYFQQQSSPAILNITPGTPLPGITFVDLPSGATQVFAKKGNISIAQLKLVLGPGQSSVRFPLAISYSNRTELITKPQWRGQIGVSYDFDSLFAKSK